MKYVFPLLLVILLSANVCAQNNIGVGTPTPDPTAIMDLTASDKGFLAPRLTTAQRTSIVNPAPGLLVFDTNVGCYFYYNGTWNSLCQLSGPTGATGATGATGPSGVTGPTGPGTICGTAANGYVTMFTSATDICNSVLYQSGNNVGVNTTTPTVSFQDNATDALGLPAGTTAQQPGAAPSGAVRYNTTLGAVEVYTGTCWQNVNTPPIGATYVQWFNAADPNAIYPCTQWVSTDIANGEFIRARGGASNVAAGAALTGTLQGQELQDHTHAFSGTIDPAGPFTTSTDGAHTHDWGGWWSNDDSRDFATGTGNGDGTGNTISDGAFWWGGSTNPNTQLYTATTSAAGAHNHGGYTTGVSPATGMWLVYDDNLSSDSQNGGFGNSSPSTCGTGWNGQPTAGNFMGRLSDPCLDHSHVINTDGNHTHTIDFYAHRHWIKDRATTSAGAHSHTIAAHTHTFSFSVGNVTGGTAGAETRPDNVAVVFWRRVN